MSRTIPGLYLASSSPQRHHLLKALELEFSVIEPRLDETPRTNEEPSDYVLRLAVQKSNKAMRKITDRDNGIAVIGADTCVSVNEKKLGKPKNQAEAREMLELLSGKVHRVYSAVAVNNTRIVRCASVVSDVEFVDLTDFQIKQYLASGEYVNRAGAYAIQGIAASFVKRVVGSLSSIIGLPVKESGELLELAGVAIPSYPTVVKKVLARFPLQQTWPEDYYI